MAWATTAPSDGTYDKCDVSIVFPDGQRWGLRYDLTADGSDSGDGLTFQANLRRRLEFYAGRHRPDHIPEDEYRTLFGPEARKESYRQWAEQAASILDAHLQAERSARPEQDTPASPVSAPPSNIIHLPGRRRIPNGFNI
jgi:hypothetical protein